MNLIEISLKRTVFAWMLMAALIVFGGLAFTRLGVSQMPDVDLPVIDVTVNYDGAGPEVIEGEIIDRLETQLLMVEGIKEMRSTVRQGSGSVHLDFAIDRNVDVALQEVQTAVSQIRFPLGADPPVVRKTNPEEQPIIFISLSADASLRELLVYADEFLLDQFRFLPNVGEVSTVGFSERNLRVWADLDALERFELTILDLIDAITTQHVEAAAGQVVERKRELRVRWMGEAYSVDEVKRLRLLRRGSNSIFDKRLTVGDVAEVEDGLTDIRRIGRVDGRPAISIGLRKQRGTNEVDVSDAVLAHIEKLRKQLPEGYQLEARINFTAPTRAVVQMTMDKLLAAGAVTILVCFLFLGSWQAALNVLFSIPTSIIGTFLAIYFCGFTLNLFTLLALTLAVSIVVDDAIMLLENIVRHGRMGKKPYQAAYDGAMEILPAAVASTLAVVAVFAPVIFMDGITGKFFFQFGIAMTCAVMLSLLEAVTITPMRAAALMSTSPKPSLLERGLDHVFDALARGYRFVLRYVLMVAPLVVIASLAGFVYSLKIFDKIKQELIPPQDQNFVVLTGQTPVGSSLAGTTDVAVKVEAAIKTIPEVESFFLSIGGGGVSGVNQIYMPITLVPRERRKVNHMQVMDKVRAGLKDVKNFKFTLRDLGSRGLTTGRQYPISFNLGGPDLETLQKTAETMVKKMTDEGLVHEMDTDLRLGVPELHIEPRREVLAKKGVSIETVARTLNAAVAGVAVTRYTAGGRRFDIRVKVPEAQMMSRKRINKIMVRNQYGNLIPLGDLVTIREVGSIQAIVRVNRQRSIGVFGQLKSGQSQAAVVARAEAIAREVLPEGYSFRLDGSAAGLAESFRSLKFALVIGVLIAYMVLAVQFNSFVQPVSVLMALPFGLTGALLALWYTGVSLNLFSFIGLIVLMGIAKKNSIMLVEFTNQVRRREKLDVSSALLAGCPVRLRPILMTSTATVAAALPLVYGTGLGQEVRTPMGLTIIGGTLVSTLLTLFVVPSLYKMLARLELNNGDNAPNS